MEKRKSNLNTREKKTVSNGLWKVLQSRVRVGKDKLIETNDIKILRMRYFGISEIVSYFVELIIFETNNETKYRKVHIQQHFYFWNFIDHYSSTSEHGIKIHNCGGKANSLS